MISTRIVCKAFVGRTDELEHLSLRRRQAGDGHGGLALIGGEPGIGKSRLIGEFKERLNRHTSIVAASACREFAQKPLGPLLEILEQAAHVHGGDLVASSKSERLDAIAGAFERVAAKRTTVAVLEDLHWADIDLIQTLLVLVRRASNKRLLFVGTYRDNELSAEHPLFKWFGQLFREPAISVVSLQRLENRELNRLMASAVEGTVKLSPPVLHAVRDRSDGNPLFAEELLRSAVDSQRTGMPASPKALPLSLHALVAERLQRCSEYERSFLRHASLFGRDFSVAQVCEVFGGEASGMQPILERLGDLQMLDATDAARGAFRFRHALTRDVVYDEMPLDTVQPLHLTIAEYLERSPAAIDAAEALGYHFWEADRRERAAAYYELAGDSAMAAFAYDDAAAYYQRAAAGFERHGAARARAYARAAQAQIFAGDLDAGLSLYDRGVELALQLGDITEVVRSRALMAGHLVDGGRRDAAIALIRETLPIAERDDALHSRLQTRLAMTLARDARLEEAGEAIAEINEADLDTGAAGTGEYYLCASELHALRGELDAWKACFARGIAIYEAHGHPGPLQVAHANFAVQSLCVGETDLARTHHRISGELARTLRFEDQTVLLAQVEFYAGNLAEARRIVDAVVPSGRFVARAMLVQAAVPLAIALGDDRMLEQYLDEPLLTEAGPKPFTATLARVAAAHAMALAATNRQAAARMLLGRVLGSLRTAFGMTLPVVAVATLLPERANELRPLLETGGPADRVGKALLGFLDAAIASSRGQPAAAKAFALDGARRFGEIGWPLLEARCFEAAGERHAALAIYRRSAAAGELRRLEFTATDGAEPATLGILTARERELALQVASGKPNRAVASALSIGEKTVEKYLTSIYAKLGLTSRAQLAALVAAAQQRAE